MFNVSIPRCNLHTHTSFCDGRETPEEIVQAAIRQGMTAIGFSGHSPMPYPNDFAMTERSLYEYREEILRLRRAYEGKIEVLLGIEQDYLSGHPYGRYDYIIGSVHTMMLDGKVYELDNTKEELLRAVREQFRGDIYLLLQRYFEMVGQLVDVTDCNIIGHFDLVTKFNEDGSLFDERDPRYLLPAYAAIDRLAKREVLFEINTGAVARGYRRLPYPSLPLLRRIALRGCRVVINSDAHSADKLLYKFDEAVMIANNIGFGSVSVLTRDGWRLFRNGKFL